MFKFTNFFTQKNIYSYCHFKPNVSHWRHYRTLLLHLLRFNKSNTHFYVSRKKVRQVRNNMRMRKLSPKFYYLD